jgi:hypothetical protein
VEAAVDSKYDLRQLAEAAFVAFNRAYATFPKELKTIFHPKVSKRSSLFPTEDNIDISILRCHLNIEAKAMFSRIVDTKRSFPLSKTFSKLRTKKKLDKIRKRYGWIYQLPRQYHMLNPLITSATSRHFWQKVPSLLRIILRTRIRICRQSFGVYFFTTALQPECQSTWQTLFTPPLAQAVNPPDIHFQPTPILEILRLLIN